MATCKESAPRDPLAAANRDTTRPVEPPRLPLKVLLFIGPERMAEIFFKALSSRYETVTVGWEQPGRFSFITYSGAATSTHSFRLPPLPRYCVLAYQWSRVFLHVLRVSGKKPFDVTIAVGIQATLLFPALRFLRVGRRFVYWAGDWFPNDRRWAFLDRKASGMTEETWNITRTIRQVRCRELGIPEEQGGAIAGTLFSHPPPFSRNMPTGRPYACYLGRVSAGSRLDLALEAMRILRDRGIAFDLVITGKQQEREQECFQNLIVAAGMQGQVRWTGFLPSAEVDVVLSGSQFGLAIAPGGLANYSNYTISSKVNHCLQMGVPLVVSTVNAMAREICERNAGFAVGDSAQDLADTMVRFCTDPELTMRLGRNAHTLAREKSSPGWLFDLVEAAAAAGRKERVP